MLQSFTCVLYVIMETFDLTSMGEPAKLNCFCLNGFPGGEMEEKLAYIQCIPYIYSKHL